VPRRETAFRQIHACTRRVLPSLPQPLDLQSDDITVVQPTRERLQRRRIEMLDQVQVGTVPEPMTSPGSVSPA